MKKVCIVMGSDSDLKVMEGCVNKLDAFGVPYDVRIVSAHRTPAAAEALSKNGKAAHLGGVLAAQTTLPVIGVPIKSSFMDGLDRLLSIVQMPSGIPVATVGVNGAENAAILAVQMLALSEPELASKLDAFKAEMAQKVEAKDAKIRAQFAK